MRPARASLTLGVGRDLLVALIVCAVAVFVSLTVQLQISERELDERSLEGAAHYIAVHLQTGSDGTTYLPELPGGSWVGFAYASLVFDRDGRLLYERPATLDPQVIRAIAEQRLPPGDRPDRGIHYFRVDIGSQRVRGAALHTGSGAEDRVIEVFRYENAPGVLIDDMVRQFPYRSLLVLLPVFGLLLLAGRWILWRRMRPIAEVSAMAENIGPHTLRLRLPEANLPREVVPIIRGVNHALDRLERATEIQRQFLRRAAHQLRTPLMLVSARAATLERTDTTQALRGDVRELTRMVMQLLQLNEIEALDGDANRITDLGAVGEAVREEMAAHSAQQDKPIALTRPPEPVLVRGDPNVIEVAVRNLVENALRHAPTGSPIELRVSHDGRLEVRDAGPGVPEILRDKVFDPFWSSDRQDGRAGLGLTIVQRVAERYDATVSVSTGSTGGAVFIMTFRPVAPGVGRSDPEMLSALPAGLARRRRREALDDAAD